MDGGSTRTRRSQERERLFLRERRAREQAEQAERRATFLAEAGRVLPSSLDCERTLSELTRLAVPYLADWCAVRLVGEDGVVRTQGLAHVDRAKLPRLVELQSVWDLPREQTLLSDPAMAKSLLFNVGTVDTFATSFPDLAVSRREDALEALRVAGLTSFMWVPLAARGELIGAMWFALSDEKRQYSHEHLLLAEALAVRAAVAIDNARLYQEAQRALQVREDFLTVASHELRTPLTALTVAVQGLLKRARAADRGEDSERWGVPLLEAVERSAARLGVLVDALLDISRLSTGAPRPILEDVDLAVVVAEVLEQSADVLRRAGCVVRWTSPGPSTGCWDRGWLVRIVSSLLSNAAKYGGGKPIELGLEGSEQTVRLTVCDHGIGISTKEQARIFERFERVVSVRHYGGFGLGLWIARRLVESLGGTVRVESQMGEGATFTVELPRRPRSTDEETCVMRQDDAGHARGCG